MVSGKMILCRSHCNSFEADNPPPPEWDLFYPRGMIGRINVELHMALLHTTYTSFGSCGFRDFFIISL